MSGIPDPAEEYFKDGLWGWVTSAWKKLVATADGLLKVQLGGQDADVEVKQTTPADLTPGVCGWDGSQWRKLTLLFGYTGIYVSSVTNTNLAAGTNTLSDTAVPAGEIHVITNILIRYVGTAPTQISARITSGGTTVDLYVLRPPVTAISYDRQGWWVLGPDDVLKLVVLGATAGDDATIDIAGFRMKIT